MPLLIAPTNTPLTVRRISGEDRIRKHLESLGIVEGHSLEVLSSTSRGVVVRVNEERLALDHDIARSITVE